MTQTIMANSVFAPFGTGGGGNVHVAGGGILFYTLYDLDNAANQKVGRMPDQARWYWASNRVGTHSYDSRGNPIYNIIARPSGQRRFIAASRVENEMSLHTDDTLERLLILCDARIAQSPWAGVPCISVPEEVGGN